VVPGNDRGYDRLQGIALAQDVLLEQQQSGKRSTYVAEPENGQADVTDRPPGRVYACLTW
jgi:hypothetical protein